MNMDAFTHIGVAEWSGDAETVRINKHLRWLMGLPSTSVSWRDFVTQFKDKSRKIQDMSKGQDSYLHFPWVTKRQTHVFVEISEEKGAYTLIASPRQPAVYSLSGVSDEDQFDPTVFFEHGSDLMCLFSANGEFKLVNSAFSRVLGYDKEAFQGVKYTEFVHPEDIEMSELKVEFSIEHGIDDSDFVNRYRKNNGEYVYIAWRALKELADGSVYCVGKDVTHTVEHVHSLSLYKRCFDIALDALIIAKSDSTIVHANQAFCDVVGLSEEDVIGTHFLSFVHPDDLQATIDTASRMSTEGIEAVNFVNRYRHSSGKYVKLAWMGASDSEIGLVTGIARDITEQDYIHQQLLRTAEALDDSQRMANIGTWEVHLENNTIFWSDQTKRIHGVPLTFEPSVEIGVRFYTEEYRPLIEADFNAAISEGKSFDKRYQIETYSGQIRWVRSVGKPEENDQGKVFRVYGVFQDVTEQVQYEQELIRSRNVAELASRQKAEFLSMMSHEIRTPLNAIVSMVHFLRNSESKDQQTEFLDVLDFSSENLLALVNDILDFSKIEAGKVELELTIENLVDVFDSVAAAFLPLAQDKNIQLQLNKAELSNEQVKVDRNRLVQVLNNLVSNAVKFTSQGRVDIIASAHVVNKRMKLHVEVRDTGCGIEESRLQDVYALFTQVHSGATRQHGGSGLGLTISKKLVNIMGGDLTATSALGVGSTFTFDIELDVVAVRKQGVPEETKAEINLAGISVLLVEDNDTNVFVAQTMLERWGSSVDVAKNGQEAVDMYIEGSYDIVLMDLHMPIMSGEEASKIIKEHQHQQQHFVPIIALTASALSESRDRVLASGLDDFVTKPIQPVRLKTAIAKNISKKGPLHA